METKLSSTIGTIFMSEENREPFLPGVFSISSISYADFANERSEEIARILKSERLF